MEQFEQLSPLEKEKFGLICNKLMASCFLYKQTDKDYYFIITHRDLFEEYLGMSNWVLNVDPKLEIIYLSSSVNVNRYRFNLRETILLLLLRVAFEQESRNVAKSDKILITIADLQERYQTLKLRDRLIDKVSLTNALSTFKRFNLVEVISSESFSASLICIHPTILALVQVQSIKEVFDKIESLSKGGGENVSFAETEAD